MEVTNSCLIGWKACLILNIYVCVINLVSCLCLERSQALDSDESLLLLLFYGSVISKCDQVLSLIPTDKRSSQLSSKKCLFTAGRGYYRDSQLVKTQRAMLSLAPVGTSKVQSPKALGAP